MFSDVDRHVAEPGDFRAEITVVSPAFRSALPRSLLAADFGGIERLIRSGVTRIQGSAFEGCVSLMEVDIPDTVTYIGSSAFKGCVGLHGIEIPTGVAEIANGAFQGCAMLTDVVLHPALSVIRRDAFRDCVSLGKITFLASSLYIESDAFRGCSALESASFVENAPGMGTGVFQDTSGNFKIFYLPGRTGFTSPTWQGYPSEEIDTAIYPGAIWLLTYGYDHRTDLEVLLGADPSKLFAYAEWIPQGDHREIQRQAIHQAESHAGSLKLPKGEPCWEGTLAVAGRECAFPCVLSLACAGLTN